MTNNNHERGARAERHLAAYLRTQGFWMAERYLREGRTNDMGDIDGVPFTTIQVKDVHENRYPEWVAATLKQQENAGTPYCLLVRRVPYKPVERWEASMPLTQLGLMRHGAATEAWTWVRMDLRLAVAQLKVMIDLDLLHSHSNPSLSTISVPSPEAAEGSPSALSTGSAGPV